MRKRFPVKDDRAPTASATSTNRKKTGRTIADVAALAGVSTATVSKYFSSREYYVSKAASERIKSAAEALDYLPNAAAQALANQRSTVIGVVVPSIVNPYYPELITGVDEIADKNGYSLSLVITDESPDKEQQALESLRRQRVAGVILSFSPTKDDRKKLADLGTAVVTVSRDGMDSEFDRFQIDSYQGAKLATQHLLEHGHDKLAHIAGPAGAESFRQRRQAFEETCSAAGISSPIITSTKRRPTLDDGYISAKKLFSTHQPTAIFVATDQMAMGVLQFCADNGIRIPEDIAVIGFDNTWVTQLPSIQLTTIDGKARDIGKAAASRLIQVIRDELATEPPSTQLTPELIRRTSCGCSRPL